MLAKLTKSTEFDLLNIKHILIFLMFLSACGVGTPNPPRNSNLHNLSYQLTLNDTGITKLVKGAADAPSPRTASTTTYYYYATDSITLPVALPSGIAQNATVTYNSSNVQYYDSNSNLQTGMSIYNYAGNSISYTFQFTKLNSSPTNQPQWQLLATFNGIVKPATTLVFSSLVNNTNGYIQSPKTVTYDTGIALGTSSTTQKITVYLDKVTLVPGTTVSNVISSQNGCSAATNSSCYWHNLAIYPNLVYPAQELRLILPNSIDRYDVNKRIVNTVPEYPNQDADFGLSDAAMSTTSGFQFQKIYSNPGPTPTDEDWVCVHDNVTGLIWEHKTSSRTSLRKSSHNYSWFDPDSATNGGMAGHLDPDGYNPSGEGSTLCNLSHCNTKEYIDYLNREKLCSRTDWRLPTAMELMTIIDFSAPYSAAVPESRYKQYVSTLDPEASVNKTYFPNLVSDDYWTSQTEPTPPTRDSNNNVQPAGFYAYALHLELIMVSHPKNSGIHILAVSGKPMQ